MINVPTDLLRSLVTVVDQRSFTKAAQVLGISQPAVSVQLKRLQTLLGCELLDKSAPGIALTAEGEKVTQHARQLLSLNDRIVQLAAPEASEQVVRIGVPGDLAADSLPPALAGLRRRYPELRFRVRSAAYGPLMRGLHEGNIDLIVALSETEPEVEAAYHWLEPLSWTKSPRLQLDPARPVPVVAFGESCAAYRIAASTLNAAGLDHEIAFMGPSVTSLVAAVSAGIGVLLLSRTETAPGLVPWHEGPAPAPDHMHGAIHMRAGGEHTIIEEVAETIAATLNVRREARAAV